MTKDKFKEYVEKLTNPIFEKALQEAHHNHRMVGSEKKIPLVTYLWQPHNYRLYFTFNKTKFNEKKPDNHTLQKFQSMVGEFNKAYTYSACNHNSEHLYKDFMFCTIKVKKKTIEIINNYHKKQWRKIEAYSIDDVSKRIKEIMKELEGKSIKALKSLIELHGGEADFKPIKERVEHGIHGDDFLDKIDGRLIYDDTYSKKLYRQKVEMKSTPAIINYISNRSLEMVAPLIAKEINNIHTLLNKDNISLTELSTVKKVLASGDRIKQLSEEMKRKIELNLFQETNKNDN